MHLNFYRISKHMQYKQKSNGNLILFNNYVFCCISWNEYAENGEIEDGKNMTIFYFYLENTRVSQKVNDKHFSHK